MNWNKCSEVSPDNQDKFILMVNECGFCETGYYDLQSHKYVTAEDYYKPVYWCYVELPVGIPNYY